MRRLTILTAVAVCVAVAPDGAMARGFGGGGYRGGGGFGGYRGDAGGFGGGYRGGAGGFGGGYRGVGGYGGDRHYGDFGGARGYGGAYADRQGGYFASAGVRDPFGSAGSGWYNAGSVGEFNRAALDSGARLPMESNVARPEAGRYGALPTDVGYHPAARVDAVTPGAAGSRLGYPGYGTRAYPGSYYHAQALGVNDWYGNRGIFSPAWSAANRWPWFPNNSNIADWAALAWTANNWGTVGSWNNYDNAPPVNYDYGGNVTYQGDNVYYGGQPVATQPEYYQQAQAIAATAATAQPAPDDKWLPLGVFGLVGPEEKTPASIYQLAQDKNGIVQGNCYVTSTGQTLAVKGAVDKKTQRVAWGVDGFKGFVIETGLYNLTQNEAPALAHFGPTSTEQVLLVRINRPDDNAQAQETKE
jgi:hypothetical protein